MFELKKKLNKCSCLLIKFTHCHDKTCVAAKILVKVHFFCSLGSPLNFDQEKWKSGITCILNNF